MSDNVLYIRDEKMSASEDENQENIWDDTLLIKAYERAVNSAKEKVASKLNLENGEVNESNAVQSNINAKGKKHRKTSTSENKEVWTVGMNCRAVYSEDGLEYEAVIKNINLRKGTCRVKYLGYNNEEDVPLSALKLSHGPEARKIQIKKCDATKDPLSSVQQERVTEPWQFKEQGMIPPPPPPHVMAHFPKDESDALSAMLMAWYMSGYHTGYYQGLTNAKTNQQMNGYNPHLK